ncbi:MAG TPA: hypothetical protein DEQ47_07725 [Solibacterales bacterium]|jgi:hypothetical protein|nr:hypothetical protein [Bryobacterales bacterium]
MRQTAFLLPLLLCASQFLPAADPQLMNMVPPDAKVIAGVNVDQAASSPFGQYVLGLLPSDPNFQQFVSVSGFDPRHDIHEILVAAVGPEKPASHLFLARGTFNVDRLLSLAPKPHPLSEQNYNGTRIFSAPGKDGMVFAFPDSNTAVAGDLASVKASLDRRSQTNSIDATLAARVSVLSSTLDAWAISTLPFSAMPRMPSGPNSKSVVSSELLAKIQQTSGGIKFGDQVHLIGEATTGDAKDATALGDVIRFVAMMIQNQAPPEAAPVTALIKNLQVVAEGTTVRMDLAIAENQIESLIAAGKQRVKPVI